MSLKFLCMVVYTFSHLHSLFSRLRSLESVLLSYLYLQPTQFSFDELVLMKVVNDLNSQK